MLYLIATPIGNLADLSHRAIEILSKSDRILCEDTRHSQILLDHYQIRRPLSPYHQFNEKKALSPLIAELKGGKILSLLSDAGTPCINDPGHLLVQKCIEQGISFTAIPGPCSPIQALLLSGFSTERFQFLGFLPRPPEKGIRQALLYPGTSIALESPERLVETLRVIVQLDPLREIAVAREMTKAFEECRRGKPSELLAHFEAHRPRGEIVLLFAEREWETGLSIEEAVAMLQQTHGLPLKEAIQTAAHLLKRPKRDVYQAIHHKPTSVDNLIPPV